MTVLKIIQELKISHEDVAKALGLAKVSLMHSLSDKELSLIDDFLVKKAKLKQEILFQIKEISSKINLLKKRIPLENLKAQRKKIRKEIRLLKDEIAKLNIRLSPPKNNTSTQTKSKKTPRKWAHIISTPMGS
jgi:hypothetical protein